MCDESRLSAQAGAPLQGAKQSLGAMQAIGIIAVYILAQMVMGIGFGLVACVYLVVTVEEAEPAAISEAMAPVLLPASILGMMAAGLIAFTMTRRILGGPIRGDALAPLGWRASSTSQVVTAALAGCALSLVYLLILVPASPPTELQHLGPLASAGESGGLPRILWAILALVLAPPIEEFVFRGVLLGGLSNTLGISAAACVVTVVFLLMHVTEALGYWPAWVGIGMLACGAALFRIKTGSLVPAVAVHFGYNLVLVIAVYLGSP